MALKGSQKETPPKWGLHDWTEGCLKYPGFEDVAQVDVFRKILTPKALDRPMPREAFRWLARHRTAGGVGKSEVGEAGVGGGGRLRGGWRVGSWGFWWEDSLTLTVIQMDNDGHGPRQHPSEEEAPLNTPTSWVPCQFAGEKFVVGLVGFGFEPLTNGGWEATTILQTTESSHQFEGS